MSWERENSPPPFQHEGNVVSLQLQQCYPSVLAALKVSNSFEGNRRTTTT